MTLYYSDEPDANLTHTSVTDMVWGGDRDDPRSSCLQAPCLNYFEMSDSKVVNLLMVSWDRNKKHSIRLKIQENSSRWTAVKWLSSLAALVVTLNL